MRKSSWGSEYFCMTLYQMLLAVNETRSCDMATLADTEAFADVVLFFSFKPTSVFSIDSFHRWGVDPSGISQPVCTVTSSVLLILLHTRDLNYCCTVDITSLVLRSDLKASFVYTVWFQQFSAGLWSSLYWERWSSSEHRPGLKNITFLCSTSAENRLA